MNNRIRRFLGIASFLFLGLVAAAQPSAVKKAGKSVVKVTTFGADGTVVSTGYGVFEDTDGTVLCAWNPLIGARSAVVLDAQGKKYEVDCILGASSYYNVARVKVLVEGKNTIVPATIESGQQPEGAEVWYAGYGGKAPVYRKYAVTKTETFMDDLPYYIVEQNENPVGDDMQGSPCFNTQGQLMGLLNTSSTRTDLYFASARYGVTLVPGALSANDNALRTTSIRIALPDDYSQAMLALMVGAQREDSLNYSRMIDEFIMKFPEHEDGYISKAEWLTDNRDFAGADAIMQTALEKAEQKAGVYYAYSRLIYNKETLMSDVPYEGWSLDKAISEIDKAYDASQQMIYRIHKGKIFYAQHKYDEALAEFQAANKENSTDAEVYYYCYQCLKNKNADRGEQLAQLDSAIVYAPRAVIYHAERTLLLIKMKKVEEAVASATQLVTIAPAYAEGHGFLGLALCLAGNKERGLVELKRAKAMGYEKADSFIAAYGQEGSVEKK